MSQGEKMSEVPRILFFGLPACVSAAALAELVAAGTRVVALVVPAGAVPHLLPGKSMPFAFLEPHQPDGLPLIGGTTADTLGIAWSSGVPVLAVRDLGHADTLAALESLAIDVAVVACFTQRIPAAALRLPRHGFLNIHPSLLPAYRGPVPVFWQMRDGAETGVTVHRLDAGLDTGDIVAQTALSLPDGISEGDAERQLMAGGTRLLLDALGDLPGALARTRPQPSGGSYYSFPTDDDFTLSTAWPARRAYNFMKATAHRGIPFRVEIAGKPEMLATADHYEADLVLDRPSVRHGNNILVRFNPGILYARLASHRP